MVLLLQRGSARRLFLVWFAAVLLAAACSGSETGVVEDSDEVETTSSDTSDETTSDNVDNQAAETDVDQIDEQDGEQIDDNETLSAEEAARQFSQCMRDEGLDFADLEVDSAGDIDTGTLLRNLNLGDPSVQTALSLCQDLLESGGLTDQLQETLTSQDFADALMEFSECVRDEGFDAPDLTVSAIMGGVLASGQTGGADSTGPDINSILATSSGLDPQDPAVQAAMVTCSPIVAEATASLGLG